MSDNPSAEAYAVGWALFLARCLEDEADRDVIDTEWAIPALRKCWMERAQVALDALAILRLEQGNSTASPDGK